MVALNAKVGPGAKAPTSTSRFTETFPNSNTQATSFLRTETFSNLFTEATCLLRTIHPSLTKAIGRYATLTVTMNSFNAALVWGTPVRPDDLGPHLQAYQTVLPTLRTLRLCHKLGTGSGVYISKLPIEIKDLIEEAIVEKQIRSTAVLSTWTESFMHFESRCEPIDHINEGYCEIFPEVESELLEAEELCEKCQAEGESRDDCNEGCRSLIDHKINIGLIERDDEQIEKCEDERMKWQSLIDQGPKGAFAKYDKV